jgi:hypothetical protein
MPGWWRHEQTEDGGGEPAGAGTTPVSVELEHAILEVEDAAARHVGGGPGTSPDELASMVQRLDELTIQGDYFKSRTVNQRGAGLTDAGVLGATTPNSLAQLVPNQELSAQVAMVRAAKAYLAEPRPDTADGLRRRLSDLDDARGPAAESETPPAP